MKKIISTTLCLCLIVSCFSISAFGQSIIPAQASGDSSIVERRIVAGVQVELTAKAAGAPHELIEAIVADVELEPGETIIIHDYVPADSVFPRSNITTQGFADGDFDSDIFWEEYE